MKLAQIATPKLMNRCSLVLSEFVQSDQRAGNLPLSKNTLAEIKFILMQLKQTEIHTSLELVDSNSRQLSANYNTSKKRHLLYLFPILCECITTKEDSIKPILKELFHMVAIETNLQAL